MANRIVLNNISYHGKGAIQEIVNEVKTNGYQHLFVATDPDLLKFGVTAKVTDILDNAGIAYTVYSKIKPNPTIQNVQEGVAAFQACGADAIVAIGGGSSMDTAKAIGIIITNPEFADVCVLWRALRRQRTTLFPPLQSPQQPALPQKLPSTMSLPMWKNSGSSSVWIPTISRQLPLLTRI